MSLPQDRAPTEAEWRAAYDWTCTGREIDRRYERLGRDSLATLEHQSAQLEAELGQIDPREEPWHYNYAHDLAMAYRAVIAEKAQAVSELQRVPAEGETAALQPLERENARLRAILCREMCDCGMSFTSDAQAVECGNHSEGCQYVQLAREADERV